MDSLFLSNTSWADWLLQSNATMPLELLRIAIALLGTAIGSYYDLFNNKNVPNNMLYAFLGIAFLVNLIAFDMSVTTFGILVGLVVFGLTYVLYKTGKLGGADVYILAALALLLPIQPKALLMVPPSSFPSLPFIFSVLLASGISFMAYMLARSFPVAIKTLMVPGTLKLNHWLGAFGLVGAYALFAFIISTYASMSPTYFLFLTIVVALSIYFTLFKDAINESMMEWVSLSKVEEEDVLAIEKMNPAVVKKYKLSQLVDSAMLKRMKGMRAKIPVLKHLPPYIPHLLIGMVLSLVLGNIVLFLAGPSHWVAY